jgi:hypothetical protein
MSLILRWLAFVALTVCVSLINGRAFAECDLDLEKEEAKVRAARTCKEAHKLYEACLWGSTGDIQRGAIVQEKCEALFLNKLNGAQKGGYRYRLAACDRKFARREGTLYQSQNAVCHADAAYAFARKYGGRK